MYNACIMTWILTTEKGTNLCLNLHVWLQAVYTRTHTQSLPGALVPSWELDANQKQMQNFSSSIKPAPPLADPLFKGPECSSLSLCQKLTEHTLHGGNIWEQGSKG